MRPVGWYVHHHGAGHAARLAAVAPHLRRPVVALGSDLRDVPDEIERVDLPLDLAGPGETAGPSPPWAHYAPSGLSGLSDRMAAIAGWISRERPALFVVDVSCEVAMLAAICGVPTCVVRQHGRRDDTPHRLAYEAAALTLAPWPAWLGGECDERTVHTGCFSRFDRREQLEPRPKTLAVMAGRGGSTLVPSILESWATALPNWTIEVVGDFPLRLTRPNLISHGWVRDPWPVLCGAEAVISHAGHNAVSEVASSGRPLIAVAEERPFGEQREKVNKLAGAEACVPFHRWPDARELREALECVAVRPLRTHELSDGNGAARAAAAIETAIAERAPRRRDPNAQAPDRERRRATPPLARRPISSGTARSSR